MGVPGGGAGPAAQDPINALQNLARQGNDSGAELYEENLNNLLETISLS